MKLPELNVTVNSGEYEGVKGRIIGYDRDKYYKVLLDNGIECEFKGYYLNGLHKMKYKTRYLLQYNDYDVPLTHEQLMSDRNEHNNKGKGCNNRSRYFTIYIKEPNGEVGFRDLYFNEIKKKVRYAMQNELSFEIFMSTHKRRSSSYYELISYDYDSNTVFNTVKGKSEKLYYGTFERGVLKIIDNY